MANQAQTLLDQRNRYDELVALAKAAAVKVFVCRYDSQTKKYQFEDGSALVIEERSAYVVN